MRFSIGAILLAFPGIIAVFAEAPLSDRAPKTEPAHSVVARSLRVGDLVRRGQKNETWFNRLSDTDQQEIVDELNHYTLIIQDDVDEIDGPNDRKVWRFTTSKPARMSIERVTVGEGRTKQLRAFGSICEVAHPQGGAEQKTTYGGIQWELRHGHGIPLTWGVQGLTVYVTTICKMSADPSSSPATTRPAATQPQSE